LKYDRAHHRESRLANGMVVKIRGVGMLKKALASYQKHFGKAVQDALRQSQKEGER
jgi:hypothetical protein